MVKTIKRIEKDFLLKTVYNERLSLFYLNSEGRHTLHLGKPVTKEMYLKASRPLTKEILPREKIELMFDYAGMVIDFTVEVDSVHDQEDLIITKAPEVLFKNPRRSYTRINPPKSIKSKVTFNETHFSLDYPRVHKFESEETASNEWLNKFDPKNLQQLIDQMPSWIYNYADNYKMLIFRETKPSTVEEHIVAETGKTLLLPSTREKNAFPQTDSHPEKRLITEDVFRRYLESTGIDSAHLNDALNDFVRQKYEAGIFSDAWIPIPFQEYIIGYIHIWINKEGKPPFNHNVINALYQFAKALVFSMKINGYFKTKNATYRPIPLEGKIVNLSDSGMLFALLNPQLSGSLLPGAEIDVELKIAKRNIKTTAKIVSCYKDNTGNYLGCHFFDMNSEDSRFLIDYLYRKSFTDSDAVFVPGSL